jgi:hypothetical protein
MECFFALQSDYLDEVCFVIGVGADGEVEGDWRM